MCLLSRPAVKTTALPLRAGVETAPPPMSKDKMAPTPQDNGTSQPLPNPKPEVNPLRAKLKARMAKTKAKAKEIKSKVKAFTRKLVALDSAIPDGPSPKTPCDAAPEPQDEPPVALLDDDDDSAAAFVVESSDFEEATGKEDSFVSIPIESDDGNAEPASEPAPAELPKADAAVKTLKGTFADFKPVSSFRALFPSTATTKKTGGGHKLIAPKGPSRMESPRARMGGILRRGKSGGKDTGTPDTPVHDAEAVVVVVRPASESGNTAVKVPPQGSDFGRRVSRAVLGVFVCFHAMPVC